VSARFAVERRQDGRRRQAVAQPRPRGGEITEREPVGDHPLRRQQGHEAQELGRRQRPSPRDPRQLGDRLVELVMVIALALGELDGDGRVLAWRKLPQHLRARPAQQHRRQARPQLVQVPRADDLAPSVPVGAVPGGEPPFGLERPIVHPLDDRRQLFEPVLHRRPGEHEPVLRRQPLDRLRGLRRPVLDPLRLVQDDQLG
jgi:hypothetical protein